MNSLLPQVAILTFLAHIGMHVPGLDYCCTLRGLVALIAVLQVLSLSTSARASCAPQCTARDPPHPPIHKYAHTPTGSFLPAESATIGLTDRILYVGQHKNRSLLLGRRTRILLRLTEIPLPPSPVFAMRAERLQDKGAHARDGVCGAEHLHDRPAADVIHAAIRHPFVAAGHRRVRQRCVGETNAPALVRRVRAV